MRGKSVQQEAPKPQVSQKTTQSCNFIGKTKRTSNLEELIEKLMKLIEDLKTLKDGKTQNERHIYQR